MSSTTFEPTPPSRGAHAGTGSNAAGNSANNTAGNRAGDSLSTGPGPSFPRVLNSEFIKFRTLLSTLILLGCTVLVVVGFGALSAWGTGQFAEAAATDPEAAAAFASQGGDLAVGVPTSGIAFAQLILGSLGVLLMSSEFSTRGKLGPGPVLRLSPARLPAVLPAAPNCSPRVGGLGSKVVELMAQLPPDGTGALSPVVIREWYSTSSLVSSM